jgi:hypothetical protein
MLLKESLQILRAPATFLIAFVLPLIMLFLFGYAISLDPARTRIGLALQDSSAPALGLAQAYENSRWFDVTGHRDVATLKRELTAGDIRGIVVIPQDFSRRLQTSEGAVVQIITDGAMPNAAGFVSAYAEGVRASWAAREQIAGRAAPPLELVPRYWFNPELASHFFLIPGSIAIVMTMIGTLLTALVVARGEPGNASHHGVPLRMPEFATKVIPYFLLGLGSMTLCTLRSGLPVRRRSRFRPALLAIASASSSRPLDRTADLRRDQEPVRRQSGGTDNRLLPADALRVSVRNLSDAPDPGAHVSCPRATSSRRCSRCSWSAICGGCSGARSRCCWDSALCFSPWHCAPRIGGSPDARAPAGDRSQGAVGDPARSPRAHHPRTPPAGAAVRIRVRHDLGGQEL